MNQLHNEPQKYEWLSTEWPTFREKGIFFFILDLLSNAWNLPTGDSKQHTALPMQISHKNLFICKEYILEDIHYFSTYLSHMVIANTLHNNSTSYLYSYPQKMEPWLVWWQFTCKPEAKQSLNMIFVSHMERYSHRMFSVSHPAHFVLGLRNCSEFFFIISV